MARALKFIKKNSTISIFLFLIIIAFVLMILLFVRNGTYSVDDTTKVIIDCPNVSTESEFECNLNLHIVGNKISGISANYALPNNVQYVSFLGNDQCIDKNCFETFASTENGFALVNINGVSDDVLLGKLRLKFVDSSSLNNKYNLSLINIELSDNNDQLVTLANATGEIIVNKGKSVIVVDDTKHIISRVPLNTTYERLLKEINITGNALIKSKDGTELSTSDITKTSDIVSFTSSGNTLSYTISVLGDVTGEGVINVNDVAQLYRYIKKKSQFDDAKILAGNIINDKDVNVNDVAQLYRYIKGKSVSLEVTK